MQAPFGRVYLDGMGWINRFAINQFVKSTPPRPRPFGLWSEAPNTVSDYTSWPSLVDRRFSDRHLPPADPAYTDGLPSDPPYDRGPPPVLGPVTRLFERSNQIDSRSTVLFGLFAQWFTDSLLRIHPTDKRKNTSNHDIDLCQIYGLRESTARILRSGEIGRLKSRMLGDEEFLPLLYDADGNVQPEFSGLPYLELLDQVIWTRFPPERKSHYYATGLERGNSSIGYTAISTLFLREHNRICGELHARHPLWNDERLFQTARNIMIVLLMKLVVEEYINHIGPSRLFNFKLELDWAEDEAWYRPNWIALEFDLLYRWHGLVPDTIRLGGVDHEHTAYRINNTLLESAGLGAAVDALSRQPAGRISLFNTPHFLLEAESISIRLGRQFRLRSFNDYRRRFGLRPTRDFSELTDDGTIRSRLAELYDDVDQLELFVGLFAEGASGRSLFGELMTQMVAVDAFSQIFTNPLLSRYVYNADTFSRYGLELIEATGSVQDMLDRNTGSGDFRASFDV